MAYAEPWHVTQARRKRAAEMFPALGDTDAGTQIRVDDWVAGGNGTPAPVSNFTQLATALGRRAAEESAPEPTFDAPDAAPNVAGWTPQQAPQTFGEPTYDPSQPDPLLTRTPGLTPLETYQRTQQASLGFFTGANPVESVRRAGRGLEGEQFSPYDLGFVRNLEEGDPLREPLARIESQLVDPINLATMGQAGAAKAIAVGIGAEEGVRALARGFGASQDTQDLLGAGANIVGNIVGPGLVNRVAPRAATWMEAADNALAEASGATEAAVRRQAPEAFQFGRTPETDELFTFGPQGERVGPTGAVREIRLGREPRMGENVNEGLRFTNLGRAEMEQLAEADRAAFQSAYDRSIAGAEHGIGGGAPARDISRSARAGQMLGDDAIAAIRETPGATINADGTVTLDVVRYQRPEQAGAPSVRAGVFYMPEAKSPYERHFKAGAPSGYGGAQRIQDRTTFRDPLLVQAAAGGKAPEAAYDFLKGKKAYESMRSEVLDAARKPWGAMNVEAEQTYIGKVEALLEKYGVNPDEARWIIQNSKGGNLLPYALQERIVSQAVQDAGYDGVIGYSKKLKGAPRLTEVFDVRRDRYPVPGESFDPSEWYAQRPQPPVGGGLAPMNIAGGADITPDEFARLAAKKAAGEALTPEEQDSVLQALGKAMGATTADEQAAAREALYNGPVPTDMREVDTGLIEGVRRRLGAPTGSTVEDALGRARQVEQGAPEGDVLAARIPNPLPMPVRARNTAAAEAGQRVGNLLRPRGLEQLGPDATVSDVIGVAQDTRRMVESQQIALSSRAKTYVDALGPTVKDGAGNYRLRTVIKADGAPALLQDVLENPARYPLTPEQAKAVADYQALVQAVRDEPRTFGVKVRTTGLEDGQSYIPRQAAADTSGTALEARGGGAAGARLRSMREKGRVFRDPEQAARAGVVYEHPLTAFQSYVRQNLEGAANQHIASMLKTFGETAADRVDPSLRGQWQSLRERISARRKTLDGQQARAASVNRAADEAIRESERANRLAVSAEVRAMLKKAKIEEFDVSTPDEIVQSFPSMESLRTEADALRAQLARRTGARGVARRLGEKEALISLRSAAEQSGGDVDRMVEILSQYAEDSARFQTETASRYAGRGATAPAFGTAERAQWEADRAASGIRKNRGPQRMAVGVEAPFDGPEAAYRAYDEIVSHAIDNSIVWTSRQPGTQAGIKAADAELRVMIREARRADAAAERAGARSVAGESARARTWAEITNLQQERDALKHRWELAQERANQVPAGRARVDQNAAPALIGTDFAEKDAKRISRYYANGILPQNAIGDVLRGAAKVNRAIIPMQAIGDASATLRQLGTVLPSHPITFAKNFGNAARDLFPGGQARYREWLASPEVQDAASRGLALVGEGGVPNDFHASWFSRVPGFKQAQQHFEMISNRNRVDIFNQDVDMLRRTGQRVDDAAMEQVARNANRITGVANNRATDAETLTEFAANWMRSRLETLTKAVADGGIEGQLARGYLKNYVATGLIAAGAAAMASGRDPREVLNPIQERNGRFSYNPNFGTVRVGGVDVDMFGSYSDLARLATMAADAGYGAITERDLTELAKPIIYAARTKGAPWLSMGADVATGENIVGDPVNSWTYWLTKPIPINAAQGVRQYQEGKPFWPSVGEGVAQFFGARANQLTPTERVQQGEYGQMSPQQQFKAIPAQAWRLVRESGQDVGGYQTYNQWRTAKVGEIAEYLRGTGVSNAEAKLQAETLVERMPTAQLYSRLRNAYETMWIAQNAENAGQRLDVEVEKPGMERRFTPNQRERQIIEAAR